MAKPRDENRRKLILDTALDMFANKSYYGVSVNDIATASQISLGSMYTYFDSKDSLVNELYRFWKNEFASAIAYGLDPLTGRAAHQKIWLNVGDFMTNFQKPFLFLEGQHHASYLDQESVNLEKVVREYAVSTFRHKFGLNLSYDSAQLVISGVFGAFVQCYKDFQVGRVPLNHQTFLTLESMGWAMAQQLE